MQTSAPVSEVAVYIPQADIWSDAPASELPMSLNVEKYVGEETVNGLQKAGYWFTYVNDDAICRLSELSPGGLKIGENTYKAVILSGCRLYPSEIRSSDVYFISNMGTKYRKGTYLFAASADSVTVLNAVTGQEKAVQGLVQVAGSKDQGVDGTEIAMTLMPNESCLVVFDRSGHEALLRPEAEWEELPIAFRWVFTAAGPGSRFQPDGVSTWETLEGLSGYSGEGIYTARFELDELPEEDILIDFGTIECAARVSVNGEKADELWMNLRGVRTAQGRRAAADRDSRTGMRVSEEKVTDG